MLLALLILGIVALALLAPALVRAVDGSRRRRAKARRARARTTGMDVADPGRERRAEQRARELLRSCVNAEEWAMYRDLGFIRVWGGLGSEAAPPRAARRGYRAARMTPAGPGSAEGLAAERAEDARYAYLIYPHKPIVAFVPSTRRLLSEYCVEFPDLTGAISRTRLPDSDDVLAKWMALTGDERRLIADANMHLPGRQVDPGRVRRDVWRLAEWERQRRGTDPVASGGR